MLFPPSYLQVSPCLLTLCRYSDFSAPEVLVETNHSKIVLPVFSQSCFSFLMFSSAGFVRWTEQCRMHMNCPWMSSGPLTPSTNQKFLVMHLNKQQAFQIYLPPDCSVIFPEIPCVVCRGSSLSRCKELLYSEMYWDLKIPVYCAWKHLQKRALDLNYVHLFPLMTSLMLLLNAC